MKTRKLRLNTETLRHLGPADLGRVAGGTAHACSVVCTVLCTTTGTGGGGSVGPPTACCPYSGFLTCDNTCSC